MNGMRPWITAIMSLVLTGWLGAASCAAEHRPAAAGPAPAAPYRTFASIEEATTVCGNVVQGITRGHVNESLDQLAVYWVLSADEYDVLRRQIMKQLDMVSGRFGRPVDARFVRQRQVADTAAELVFVERFEKHLLRWTFTFYNPGQAWQLNAISFDDDIDRLFE